MTENPPRGRCQTCLTMHPLKDGKLIGHGRRVDSRIGPCPGRGSEPVRERTAKGRS